jgi:hypothetical protein
MWLDLLTWAEWLLAFYLGFYLAFPKEGAPFKILEVSFSGAIDVNSSRAHRSSNSLLLKVKRNWKYMHDCPQCEAPLHGHEKVCPRCGTKQHVTSSYDGPTFEETRPFNPIPMVVGLVVVGGALFYFASHSWIGEMLTRGPVKEDPMATVTAPQARQMIQDKVTAGLSQINAKAKFEWKSGEKAVDIMSNPKEQRKSIMDPVKDLMEKANVATVTLNDTKAHATWTYNLGAPAGGQPADAAPPE